MIITIDINEELRQKLNNEKEKFTKEEIINECIKHRISNNSKEQLSLLNIEQLWNLITESFKIQDTNLIEVSNEEFNSLLNRFRYTMSYNTRIGIEWRPDVRSFIQYISIDGKLHNIKDLFFDNQTLIDTIEEKYTIYQKGKKFQSFKHNYYKIKILEK